MGYVIDRDSFNIFKYKLKVMKIFNTTNINEVDFIQGRKGEYRAIVKCRAGFMTVSDNAGTSAIDAFRGYKKGALQSIQFKAEGTDHWLTVFAFKGKKVVLMDKQMFMDMEVGDINQNYSNTNLYSQENYKLAGAKTWADKAFIKNAA